MKADDQFFSRTRASTSTRSQSISRTCSREHDPHRASRSKSLMASDDGVEVFVYDVPCPALFASRDYDGLYRQIAAMHDPQTIPQGGLALTLPHNELELKVTHSLEGRPMVDDRPLMEAVMEAMRDVPMVHLTYMRARIVRDVPIRGAVQIQRVDANTGYCFFSEQYPQESKNWSRVPASKNPIDAERNDPEFWYSIQRRSPQGFIFDMLLRHPQHQLTHEELKSLLQNANMADIWNSKKLTQYTGKARAEQHNLWMVEGTGARSLLTLNEEKVLENSVDHKNAAWFASCHGQGEYAYVRTTSGVSVLGETTERGHVEYDASDASEAPGATVAVSEADFDKEEAIWIAFKTETEAGLKRTLDRAITMAKDCADEMVKTMLASWYETHKPQTSLQTYGEFCAFAHAEHTKRQELVDTRFKRALAAISKFDDGCGTALKKVCVEM